MNKRCLLPAIGLKLLLFFALAGILTGATRPARAQDSAEVGKVYSALLAVLGPRSCDYHLHILIAVDNSHGFFNGKSATFEAAWSDMAKKFLRKGDQVYIVPFGAQVQTQLEYRSPADTMELRNGIAGIHFAPLDEGGKCIHAARVALITEAQKQIAKPDTSLFVLLEITDGAPSEPLMNSPGYKEYQHQEHQSEIDENPAGNRWKLDNIPLKSQEGAGVPYPYIKLFSMVMDTQTAGISPSEDRIQFLPNHYTNALKSRPRPSPTAGLGRLFNALLLALMGFALALTPILLLQHWWKTLEFSFTMTFPEKSVYKGNIQHEVTLPPGGERAIVIASKDPEPHQKRLMHMILDPDDSSKREVLVISTVLRVGLFPMLEWKIKPGKSIELADREIGPNGGERILTFDHAARHKEPFAYYLGFHNQPRQKVTFQPGKTPERIKLKGLDIPLADFKWISGIMCPLGVLLICAGLYVAFVPKKAPPHTPVEEKSFCRPIGNS